jgi:uncharacterized protein (TIGR02147 family)
MPASALSIFDYSSYLEFLKDWFEEQKSGNKSFSYAWFSTRAGFRSRSFMQFVLRGERPLSVKSAFKVAQALGLNKRETQYFETLISFAQARTDEEKTFLWDKIRNLNKSSKAIKLKGQEFDFFKHWYVAPLRELVCNIDFKDDFAFLGRQLSPQISAKEAKEAFSLLLDLKLIRAKGSIYEHADLHLKASEEMHSLALRNFQKMNNQLAFETFERHRKEERNISTITLGTTDQGFADLQELIQSFHEDVVRIVEKYDGADRAYQLNLQLFPVTRPFRNKPD